MTNQEAIERLQTDADDTKGIIEDSKPYPRDELEQYVESLELAIAALEKRKPKEPESKWTEGSVSPLVQKHRAGRCPVCGQGVRDYMKFCHHCGQALNWKEDAD